MLNSHRIKILCYSPLDLWAAGRSLWALIIEHIVPESRIQVLFFHKETSTVLYDMTVSFSNILRT